MNRINIQSTLLYILLAVYTASILTYANAFGQSQPPVAPLTVQLPPTSASGMVISGWGGASLTISALSPATPANALVGHLCPSIADSFYFIAYDSKAIYTCDPVHSVFVANPLPTVAAATLAAPAGATISLSAPTGNTSPVKTPLGPVGQLQQAAVILKAREARVGSPATRGVK